MRTKVIALPCLEGLKPTLESTAIKLLEEAGELAEAIGKFRALSGEPSVLDAREVAGVIARELLDVAQTAVTMMFVLEEQLNVDIQTTLQEHIAKLARKGYLAPVGNPTAPPAPAQPAAPSVEQ